ncbi:MAG TPA: hypothetical protein VFV43_02930 [Limnobacter sp.]|nr:hypothetical protein [Limnobacter sp.]
MSAAPLLLVDDPHRVIRQAQHAWQGMRRAALWVEPGIDSALAARRLLQAVSLYTPHMDWAVLGPRDHMVFFDMEPAVTAYIPLLSMQPRRPAQSALVHWWQVREQSRKLANLEMDLWVGGAAGSASAPLQAKPHPQFVAQLKYNQRHRVNAAALWCTASLAAYASLPGHRPLELGPRALAKATALFRSWPPKLAKCVVVLGAMDEPLPVLQRRAEMAEHAVQQVGGHAMLVVLAVGELLRQRRLASAFPQWHWLAMPDCLGALAYADRVICHVPEITHLLAEMGRSDRLLLDKTDI